MRARFFPFLIMDNIESEETLNDDTTLSELISSNEIKKRSNMEVFNGSSKKLPLEDELQISIPSGEISGKYSDTANEVMTSQQINHGMIGLHIRNVHIPYILNGELYQIQTQDGENVTVKCCHCPPDRVYRGSVRSTGNFHMHIKRRHPDLLEKLHNMKVNALLERRDRLMRSRKFTYRYNRNRTTNSVGHSNDKCLSNTDEQSNLTTTNVSETKLASETDSSLIHDHKLKIMTVFQKHQIQQREAMEMGNWVSTEYVVMPIDKSQVDEESEQPINYSLNSKESHVVSPNCFNVNQHQELEQISTKSNITTTQPSYNKNLTNPINQPTNLTICNSISEKNQVLYDDSTYSRKLSTTSVSISYPGDIRSFSSNQQNEIGTIQPCNNNSHQSHNLSIIKPEHLFLGGEGEAINLTMNIDSGIYSSSEDNDSENNSDERKINNIRADNQNAYPANGAMIDVDSNSDSSNNNNSNTAKWEELSIQVENLLRNIQHEMNVRNQIESKRIFLDIAKFKFLNPGFQFNW